MIGLQERVRAIIEFIVTDLDNTLLNKRKEVSGYSAEVLKKCQDQGIPIVFATARPERATRNIQKSVQPDYIIANNGATIIHKGTVLDNKVIAPDIIEKLLLNLRMLADVTHITVEAGDCLYTNFSAVPWDNENWNPVYHDFQIPPGKPIPKISVECRDAQVVRDLISEFPNLHIYHNSGENWLQIMHRDATKMKAIRYISPRLHIPVENIVAFGDDFNDVDMINHCGTGIAVANANEAAKRVADHICPANNDDGVAKWLNAFFHLGFATD